jgi:hypothetical protein
MKRNPPAGENVVIHGAVFWHYATVDGRLFKVSEDEDGYLILRESIHSDTWILRDEEDYIPIAEMIMSHSLFERF